MTSRVRSPQCRPFSSPGSVGLTRDNPIYFFGQFGILAEAGMMVFGEMRHMTSRGTEVKPDGAEEHLPCSGLDLKCFFLVSVVTPWAERLS